MCYKCKSQNILTDKNLLSKPVQYDRQSIAYQNLLGQYELADVLSPMLVYHYLTSPSH